MYGNKPVIGLAGGIGSGKSFVAALFAEAGCMVLNADQIVAELLGDDEVRRILREWWGDSIFDPSGQVNRSAVAKIVFSDPQALRGLEDLLHPRVAEVGRQRMGQADPSVRAFVWDAPLLFEAKLDRECDTVVFVDAPEELRRQRVMRDRGWQADELARRENFQLPLYKKREMSEYMICNAADADQVRLQVREVLSRILAGVSGRSGQDRASDGA